MVKVLGSEQSLKSVIQKQFRILFFFFVCVCETKCFLSVVCTTDFSSSQQKMHISHDFGWCFHSGSRVQLAVHSSVAALYNEHQRLLETGIMLLSQDLLLAQPQHRYTPSVSALRHSAHCPSLLHPDSQSQPCIPHPSMASSDHQSWLYISQFTIPFFFIFRLSIVAQYPQNLRFTSKTLSANPLSPYHQTQPQVCRPSVLALHLCFLSPKSVSLDPEFQLPNPHSLSPCLYTLSSTLTSLFPQSQPGISKPLLLTHCVQSLGPSLPPPDT